MCGIAGIFAYHYAALPVDRDELRAIRDHMAARGPDGKGEWVSENNRVGLAHRRLSIIDLSERAAQPMASADGQLVISFNGEIYNYHELRQGLEAKGRFFRTESDTEVLLQLYAEKGEAMLAELRGMFAFAIWDSRKQSMLLARDPYGIKPLYLADDGWTCRFASQVKALLKSGKVSRLPEPAGLAGFYLIGSVPEPYTLYQEIRSVPAGSYQWVDATGPHAAVQYFSLTKVWAEAEQTKPLAEAELQEAVRAAALDSVRAHMVADVPVGAFLSAGIDSGALVGMMSEVLSPQSSVLSTITLAFEEFRNTHADEAPLAEKVARHYGVEHTVRTVNEQEFREDLPRILTAMDQPSIDGINTWFVSKAAKEAGLKVAVSGVGGDELFGGYPSFRDIPRWVKWLRAPAMIPLLGELFELGNEAAATLTSALSPQSSVLGSPKLAGLLRYGGTYPGAYLLKRGLFLPRELPELIGKELAHEGLRRLQPLQHIQRQLAPPHPSPTSGGGREGEGVSAHRPPLTAHGRVSTLESALYLRNQLLRDTDWASMAHSLEVRTPLVDATMLRKLAGPLVRAGAGNHKHLLAGSPPRPLPDEIASRAKSGFTTPIAEWQKRGDSTQAWRNIPALANANCPWARRWGYAIAPMQGVSI
jgi:asparagine synthase (glutamine-hydrolysing)